MSARLLLVLLVAALASGCTSPAPQAPPADVAQAVAAAPADDGTDVQAFRVVPRITVLDWTEAIQPRPCQPAAPGRCEATFANAENPVTRSQVQAGLTWNRPERTVMDEDAVFWRVSAAGNWSTQSSLVTALRISLLAVAPCGASCTTERVAWTKDFTGDVELSHVDVYLEDGDAGVRLAIGPVTREGFWGVQDVRFHLDGVVAGFVQAGPVIHLTPDPGA